MAKGSISASFFYEGPFNLRHFFFPVYFYTLQARTVTPEITGRRLPWETRRARSHRTDFFRGNQVVPAALPKKGKKSSVMIFSSPPVPSSCAKEELSETIFVASFVLFSPRFSVAGSTYFVFLCFFLLLSVLPAKWEPVHGAGQGRRRHRNRKDRRCRSSLPPGGARDANASHRSTLRVRNRLVACRVSRSASHLGQRRSQ